MNASPLARRAALTAALALTAGLGLSGCSDVARTDDAARIDDVVVTTEEVQTASRELVHLDEQQPQEISPAGVAAVLAYGRFAKPIAEKYNIGLTEAAVIDRFPNSKNMSEASREAVRSSFIVNEILGKNERARNDLLKGLANAKIEMNPRYGSVDKAAKNGLPLTPATIPWLKGGGLPEQRQP